MKRATNALLEALSFTAVYAIFLPTMIWMVLDPSGFGEALADLIAWGIRAVVA